MLSRIASTPSPGRSEWVRMLRANCRLLTADPGAVDAITLGQDFGTCGPAGCCEACDLAVCMAQEYGVQCQVSLRGTYVVVRYRRIGGADA